MKALNTTISVILFSFGLALVISSCNTEDPEPDVVSFANDIQPIFSTSCAYGGCHDAFEEAGQLNLSAGSSYAEIVGVSSFLYPNELRVEVGNATTSVLTKMLRGMANPAMPLFTTALPEEDIAKVEEWVNDGALNN